MQSKPCSTIPSHGTADHARFTFTFLLLLLLLCSQHILTQTLNVATVNVWSGLDYRGVWSIGEYESAELREKRFRILADELKALNADIIALQEANPSGGFACRLAEELGYNYIHQRVNAGIKAWKVGIPLNLNEGLVLLARKELRLTFVNVWDLSASFGAYGNAVSFHLSENNIALVGKITVQGRTFFVINTHLTAAVPENIGTRKMIGTSSRDTAEETRASELLHAGALFRFEETKTLADKIIEECSTAPVILLGDFNAEPDSPEIRFLTEDRHFLDAGKVAGIGDRNTWDPEKNSNVSFSRTLPDSSETSPMERLSAQYDAVSRRIDYIFVNDQFRSADVTQARLFLDHAQFGIFSSDHYGISARIDLPPIEELNSAQREPESEYFPIISYDSDAGFGYGAKAFLLNTAGADESFDLVLFNSTKGERWYRFVFSMPDFELRQGTVFPLAFDLTIDYDKWISNSFFGIGNRSVFSRREIYTREPLEISAAISRGFSPTSVLSIGVRYKTVKNFNFSDSSGLIDPSSPLNTSRATMHSLFAEYRFDLRDSYVHPSRGYLVQGEIEVAPKSSFANASMMRLGSTVQYYSTLFYPKTIFAFRARWQTLSGGNIPVQMLISVGGNQTLRGSPQDRFLDKTSAVINAEIRFPLIGRLGGVFGLDAGKVWDSPRTMDLNRWASNPVAGLRLSMDTFVVRMDIGFGHETTGFYLNFGHLF